MRIYNIKLSVQMNEMGELLDLPPEPETETVEKFNDDPLDKANKLMDKWAKQMNPSRGTAIVPLGGMYPGEGNGTMLSQNFAILATDFEEAQQIVQRFYSLAKEIHQSRPAPVSAPPPIPSFG